MKQKIYLTDSAGNEKANDAIFAHGGGGGIKGLYQETGSGFKTNQQRDILLSSVGADNKKEKKTKQKTKQKKTKRKTTHIIEAGF